MPETPNAPPPSPGAPAPPSPAGDAGRAPTAPEPPSPPEAAAPDAIRRARARGRKVAWAIYYAVAAGVCVAGAAQVTQQVYFSPARPSPYKSCREGLLALAAAVERARTAAPGTDGEDAALERFRGALLPEWDYRDSIAGACRGKADDERALDAIERLRYAEEHAVRREAGDLAPLRRRVQAIVETELGSGPPPGPPLPRGTETTAPPTRTSAGDRR